MGVTRGLFEVYVANQGYSCYKDETGNYVSPSVQQMWGAWLHYESLQYSHLETINVLNNRISRLLKETHELDTRCTAARNMAAGLAEELAKHISEDTANVTQSQN